MECSAYVQDLPAAAHRHALLPATPHPRTVDTIRDQISAQPELLLDDQDVIVSVMHRVRVPGTWRVVDDAHGLGIAFETSDGRRIRPHFALGVEDEDETTYVGEADLESLGVEPTELLEVLIEPAEDDHPTPSGA